MKIGFDLDGVLCTQSTTEIVLMKGNSLADKVYYGTRKPLLNPFLFTHPKDEVYVITARRKDLVDVTLKWCKRFLPNLQVFPIATPQWKDHTSVQEWFKEVAHNKAKVINKLGIEVYFEDMPVTVKELRKLCPNCKVIQYGGRIE